MAMFLFPDKRDSDGEEKKPKVVLRARTKRFEIQTTGNLIHLLVFNG